MSLLEQSNLLTWLGLLAVINIFWWFFVRIHHILRLYLSQRKSQRTDLSSLGEWAVVTGSTDGIGKAFAFEFAKRGFNVIIISRSEEKLKNTAKEIEEKHGVKTFYIQADFKDRNCYSHIKEQIKGKDIAILVNNVGVIRYELLEFCEAEDDSLWEELDVCVSSAIFMTRMVLPQMKSKRKGIIAFMSSQGPLIELSYMGLYVPLKTFLNAFSKTLQLETDAYNIKLRCFIPGLIQTRMLSSVQPFCDKLKYILPSMVPDSEVFAKHAVDSLSENILFSSGYWPHTLQELVLCLLPESWRARITRWSLKFIHDYSEKKLRESERKCL